MSKFMAFSPCWNAASLLVLRGGCRSGLLLGLEALEGLLGGAREGVVRGKLHEAPIGRDRGLRVAGALRNLPQPQLRRRILGLQLGKLLVDADRLALVLENLPVGRARLRPDES